MSSAFPPPPPPPPSPLYTKQQLPDATNSVGSLINDVSSDIQNLQNVHNSFSITYRNWLNKLSDDYAAQRNMISDISSMVGNPMEAQILANDDQKQAKINPAELQQLQNQLQQAIANQEQAEQRNEQLNHNMSEMKHQYDQTVQSMQQLIQQKQQLVRENTALHETHLNVVNEVHVSMQTLGQLKQQLELLRNNIMQLQQQTTSIDEYTQLYIKYPLLLKVRRQFITYLEQNNNVDWNVTTLVGPFTQQLQEQLINDEKQVQHIILALTQKGRLADVLNWRMYLDKLRSITGVWTESKQRLMSKWIQEAKQEGREMRHP